MPKPTVKHQELKEKFLEYYRQLPVLKLAAASIGRNEDTVQLWKNDDSVFSDHIEQAKAEWALSNTKRVRSKEWLLERVMRNHFAERKEITGADGEKLEPLQVIIIEDKSNAKP